MARAGESGRPAILRHALAVASRDGLEGITIGRLAADLEMSKSGVFGHFGSKEELQLATFQEAVRVFARSIVQPALAEPPGIERLRALALGYLEGLERPTYPGGCFLATATTEFDDRPGPVRDAVTRALEAWLAQLEMAARDAGAEDPRQVAFELHALGQAANQSFQLFRDREAIERARRATVRVLDAVAESAAHAAR